VSQDWRRPLEELAERRPPRRVPGWARFVTIYIAGVLTMGLIVVLSDGSEGLGQDVAPEAEVADRLDSADRERSEREFAANQKARADGYLAGVLAGQNSRTDVTLPSHSASPFIASPIVLTSLDRAALAACEEFAPEWLLLANGLEAC
jgi:hypothetical protein